MIDAAESLLSRDDLPSWEADAACRRDLERMAEGVHRYRLAARRDPAKAARIAHDVNALAARVRIALTRRGYRHA